MASDDELKDEELVDFEGSDYDIDGDFEEVEEEEEEEEGGGGKEVDLVRTELHDRQSDAEARDPGGNGASTSSASASSKVTECSALGGSGHKNVVAPGALETLSESKKAVTVVEAMEPLRRGANGASESHEAVESALTGSIEEVTSVQRASDLTCQVAVGVAMISQSTKGGSLCIKQLEHGTMGMDTGDTMSEHNQKDGNAFSGSAPSMRSNASGAHCTSEHSEGRPGLASSKPDLEDGELDETAVPLNYGLDADEEFNDETSGRERKRKKEGSVLERQSEDTGDTAGKLHHSSGSDKAMDCFAGLTFAGGRGVGLRMIGLGQGSLAPGIMGPGRPLLPIGIANLAQGFNPFRGLTPHGQPQVHLQEVLAQEHLLRVHALQLAQETLANAIRPPLTHPSAAAAFQPFMGFDIPGQRSHALHFPRPPPDLLMGPMGNFARGQRPYLPTGRAGGSGKVGGPADSNFCSGTRQFGWPAVPGPSELQTLKWARGRGGGLRFGLWGDAADSFGTMPGGLVSAGHPRSVMNTATPSSIRHLNPDDTIFYQASLGAPQGESDLLHNGFDARWKIEKERMLRNGLPHLQMPNSPMLGENPSGGRQSVKDSAKAGEVKLLRPQDSSKTGLAARLGPSAQAKVAKPINADSGDLAVATNVIKLHQPVRKSRILSVSGLPEDTPISTVVEVFEKLGKIRDFKKSTKGGIFTISYSSETEAVTAKRNLHRSYIAGKQITVDYAYP